MAWAVLYVLLAIAPLGVAVAADPFAYRRPGGLEVAVGLGFLAYTLGTLQFALVSRFGPVSRQLGGDVLLYLHRAVGVLVLVLAVGHAVGAGLRLGGGLGVLALAAAAGVVATSLFRRSLSLSYETWQLLHVAGASVLVLGAAGHILSMGGYARAAPARWTVAAYVGLFGVLLVRQHVLRPLRLQARPWRVVENRALGGDTRLLALEPEGHAGLSFEPGQFVWLLTGASPVSAAHHPLSLASSPGRGVQLAVKACGDWSRDVVPALGPGTRVWVDGPYGAFTPRADSRRPLVLIAGGVGIAPMRSILQALADRADRRPIVLVHAAADPSRALFVEELDALVSRLDLRIVRVYESEHGLVTRPMLASLLPAHAEVFVCGPPPMIDSVERSLRALAVPASRIHTERFQVV